MRIDILWNNETTRVDLADGTVTVGGSTHDGIHIAGLPHALLTLTVEGTALKVFSQRSVRIGQALFPARIPRLVLEGEELKLPNDVVLRRVLDSHKRESRKTIGTAFVAKELLATGEIELVATRAASLTCVTGLDEGRTFPIAFESNVIGRADDAQIRVRDRAVSRQHAVLKRQDRDFVLEPVSSAMNGAYVNGALLRRTQTLQTGDTIEVGHTVLRFDSGERAPEERTLVTPATSPVVGRVDATRPAPNPAAESMGASEIKFAAGPVAVPKAADVPKATLSIESSVKVSPELQQPPPALAVAGEPVPLPVPVVAKKTLSLELLLMSAGAALCLLGLTAVVLVLR
ncbi:MAG: FHA domain-containing protein [Archangium sp.]